MKKITLLLLAFIFCLYCTQLNAQDDKATRKEWAAKLKKTDPFEFRRMVQEGESMQKDLEKLKTVVVDLQKELDASKTDNIQLKTQLEQKEAELASALARTKSAKPTKSASKTPNASGSGAASANTPAQYSKGVVFKVQIGAFKNKDLTKYFDNNPNFSGDTDGDGAKKYTLGFFTDYWEADTFKKYLREMGVKDAWIVSYKDGRRVPIKDVLEGAI